MVELAICVDFGSTFTKAALVDPTRGRIPASASHPTTIATDVLDGYDACLAQLLGVDPRAVDAEVIVRAAGDLVASGWAGPVVVAGNVDARAEVCAALGEVPHVLADNLVPRIGVLAPESARSAIRGMFLAQVIGGKHLSARVDAPRGGVPAAEPTYRRLPG